MEHTTTILHRRHASGVEYEASTIGKAQHASGIRPSSLACATLAAAWICLFACPSLNHGTGSFEGRPRRQNSCGRPGSISPVEARLCEIANSTAKAHRHFTFAHVVLNHGQFLQNKIHANLQVHRRLQAVLAPRIHLKQWSRSHFRLRICPTMFLRRVSRYGFP